jgi:hypothetical protein
MKTYYRPEWSHVDDDGTIHVRISVWEEDEHSTGSLEVAPGSVDFLFWAWLTSDPGLRRGVKSEDDIAQLKRQFATG